MDESVSPVEICAELVSGVGTLVQSTLVRVQSADETANGNGKNLKNELVHCINIDPAQ